MPTAHEPGLFAFQLLNIGSSYVKISESHAITFSIITFNPACWHGISIPSLLWTYLNTYEVIPNLSVAISMLCGGA
jgi:hypothetical protein